MIAILLVRLRAWLRRALGVEQDAAELRAALDASTVLTGRLIEQLNRTTVGAADTAGRLHFYEEHIESIRFQHGRLKQKVAKPNGEGRIHLLGDPS